MAENVPQRRARSARTNRFRPLLVAYISNNKGPAQTTVYYGAVGLSRAFRSSRSGAGVALGDGLHRVVTHFGISQSLLGNTAIVAAVEVEEVSRVVVPTRHGRGDVALGNVFGTIAHFAAFNAGLIALVRPIHLDSASLHLHLPAAAASVLILAGLTTLHRGLRRFDGALLLALYGGYVAAAIALAT